MIKLKKILLVVSFVIAGVATSVAQEATVTTLHEQFQTLIKKSSVFQTYRVVPIDGIQDFGKNLNDSLNASIEKISVLKREINNKDLSIDELKVAKDSLNNAMLELTASKESMVFLGVQTSKAKYNTGVWTIIVILSVLVGILAILFKRSNILTSATKSRLDEIQEEFEAHRRSALEREQKLARKLHTELHKNR